MAMKDDIAIIREHQVGMAKDITYIKKAIEGNGEPGLISDTRANTNYRIGNQAKSKMLLTAVGSGWVIAIIFIVLQLLGAI